MAEPGFLGSTDITMDDGSMDVNARSIDEKMSKLSNNLSSLPPDESTITAKASSVEAYTKSQDLVDLFTTTLAQDIENITSVKNAFKRIDTEVQGQIESLTDFF